MILILQAFSEELATISPHEKPQHLQILKNRIANSESAVKSSL
jgi:hypothetical protein